MENTISYILVVNLWFIMGILFYKTLLRNKFHYQFNRFFLLSLSTLPFLLCAIRLPFENGISIQHSIAEITVGLSNSVIQTTDNSISWTEVLIGVYVFGIMISLSRRLVSSVLLIKKYRHSIAKAGYQEVAKSKVAFSFLGKIYIGADLTKEEKTVILEHEKVHVKAFHFIDLLISQLVEVVFFFNPFVYQVCSLMQENHELEADQIGKTDRKAYLNILLQQHFQTNQSFVGLTHSFNTHHLKRRIMHLQNKNSNGSNKTALALSFCLFIGLFSLAQWVQAEKNLSEVATKVVQDENVELPTFPGGQEALMNFLIDNLKYPESAKKEGVSGTAFVKVIIDKSGQVMDLKLLKEIDDRLSTEAFRVLKLMPNWKPAMKDGKAVKGEVTIPIKFAIPPTPPKPPKAPEAPKVQ